MTYDPTFESLSTHPLPTWWSDAKLGIFVHWSVSSIPAFAPTGADPFELARTQGWEKAFSHTPYAEWYENSISIDGSPAQLHHEETHGGAPYEAFGEAFVHASAGWQPSRWASLFAAAGARYCVMVTKHHDGFCLWPTDSPNPNRPDWFSPRDLVGECADAVREAGLRFGVYYSGGIDWRFQGLPITSMPSMFAAIPQSEEYREYADSHWRELMARYEPDVLWDDIGYPQGAAGAMPLIAEFYNTNPQGVVNDRWDIVGVLQGRTWADYVTPEFSSGPPMSGKAFEVCRGLGCGFGYNAQESAADYLTGEALIRLFVDIVAAGGNLLINVGPMATGEIPWPQQAALLELGHWLGVNGEAIYASRPRSAMGDVEPQPGVRWTTVGDATFAIVTERPASAEITLADLPAGEVSLLGYSATLQRNGTTVTLPYRPSEGPPFVLRITPTSD